MAIVVRPDVDEGVYPHGRAVARGAQLDRIVVCVYRLSNRKDVGAKGKYHQTALSAGGVSSAGRLCVLGGGHHLELRLLSPINTAGRQEQANYVG